MMFLYVNILLCNVDAGKRRTFNLVITSCLPIIGHLLLKMYYLRFTKIASDRYKINSVKQINFHEKTKKNCSLLCNLGDWFLLLQSKYHLCHSCLQYFYLNAQYLSTFLHLSFAVFKIINLKFAYRPIGCSFV